MVKNALAGRTEWPSPQRVRKKRDAKIPYHNNTTRNPHRNVSGLLENLFSRSDAPFCQQSMPEQLSYAEALSVFDFTAGPSSFEASLSPHDQAGDAWLSSPELIVDDSTRKSDGLAQRYETTFQPSWQTETPFAGNFIPDPKILSGSQFGSYESFDSLALTVNTATSSSSDCHVCPKSGSTFGSPEASHLPDYYLPESFYHARHSLGASSPVPRKSNSPQYPEPFALEPDYLTTQWAGIEDEYKFENDQWASAIIPDAQVQNFQSVFSGNAQIPSQSTWDSHAAQDNGEEADQATGRVAFESPPALSYKTVPVGAQCLRSDQRMTDAFAAQPVSPTWDGENEEWYIVPSHPPSSIRSQESPRSQDSPWSHIGSPPPGVSSSQTQSDLHSHIFSAYLGEQKAPPVRGRQRALTFQEKQEALVVRKAKACWACHLSKIKCSPCSPGSPCQQCERLSGKRRFCWLPCFNDPLETLQTFMAPDYLYGVYTQARVESFINENTEAWGTHQMVVRMEWGYRKPFEETVVAIKMRKGSQLAYHHQTIANGNSQPTLLRKNSPPLGLPLTTMDNMLSKYSSFVQRIVTEDLMNYVAVPYVDQESSLPERLLLAIARFYSAAFAAGDKCEMLRQALETHIIMTILERSLILDKESHCQVENHLQQKYPARSAARLVQRQLKLAFYQMQRARISKVLEEWGREMWTSNKHIPPERKWAITFSVFITLMLVADKILASAYLFCEAQIKHHGADPRSERAEFRDLVRLTEKELFDRCKEIFHTSFKTRKAGKEAYNPIRDGQSAFRGKAINEGISGLVWDLESLIRDFEPEIRSHKSSKAGGHLPDEVYLNKGRLASVFLADFLEH